MKNLSRLFFAMLLLLSFNAKAQDSNNPWAIGIGVNAVDFYPTGEDAPLGDYFDKFFNFGDHYNVAGSARERMRTSATISTRGSGLER